MTDATRSRHARTPARPLDVVGLICLCWAVAFIGLTAVLALTAR